MNDMRTESIVEYLQSRLNTSPVHVLGLTETWHNKPEPEVKKAIAYHHPNLFKQYMIYTDRKEKDLTNKTRGNGTMIFLHKSLRPFIRQILRIPGKGISLKLGQHSKEEIVIGVFYNQHHMSSAEEMEILKRLNVFWAKSDIKILGGDFNGTMNPTWDRKKVTQHNSNHNKPETIPNERICARPSN